MQRPSRLSDAEVSARLQTVPAWTSTGRSLERELRFRDFSEAFGFMVRGALAAERLNHHPDWSNSYSRVRVSLTTHDAEGLTPLDFELATALDALVLPRA